MRAWLRWTIANTIALVIGFPLGLLLGGIVHDTLDARYPRLAAILAAMMFGVVVGLASGTGQRIVVNRSLQADVRRWISPTLAGSLIGAVAGMCVLLVIAKLGGRRFALAGVVLAITLMGALIGLAQCFALPRSFPRGLWVAASTIGWASGIGLVAVGIGLYSADSWSGDAGSGPDARTTMLILGAILVAPIVSSVLSGAVWLLTGPVSHPLCPSCGYDLTGLTGSICPECGRGIPASTSDDAQRSP